MLEIPRQICIVKIIQNWRCETPFIRVKRTNHKKGDYYYFNLLENYKIHTWFVPILGKNLKMYQKDSKYGPDIHAHVIERIEPITLYDGFFNLVDSLDPMNIEVAFTILRSKIPDYWKLSKLPIKFKKIKKTT